jgi:hypothetical protein
MSDLLDGWNMKTLGDLVGDLEAGVSASAEDRHITNDEN